MEREREKELKVLSTKGSEMESSNEIPFNAESVATNIQVSHVERQNYKLNNLYLVHKTSWISRSIKGHITKT